MDIGIHLDSQNCAKFLEISRVLYVLQARFTLSLLTLESAIGIKYHTVSIATRRDREYSPRNRRDNATHTVFLVMIVDVRRDKGRMMPRQRRRRDGGCIGCLKEPWWPDRAHGPGCPGIRVNYSPIGAPRRAPRDQIARHI